MYWFASHNKWLLITAICFNVVLGSPKNSTTTDKCNKPNRGKHKLFTDATGNDLVLICMKSDGIYRWKFIDGTPSLGEKFDPAKDCTDIVEHLANPKDDFYWIEIQKGKLVKVWCDVNTDGGGFMLIGVNDSPVLWSVPSNSLPVNPKGPSHWSNLFGNLTILDFAVQISTNNGFEKTKAHWFYRLKSRRALENLLGVGSGGCTSVHSGVGNVLYVKDILTNTVVNKHFSCSKFGPHVNQNLGWGRMNYCLKHSCPKGYAFLPGNPFKLDSFGSFSYSANSSLSGATHDATAFVGCNNQKCCACFGPKWGRGDYCAVNSDCKPINGGTVTKQAFVWFWIRTRMAKRVWKRCMEFKLKTDQGNVETFFIDRKTGSARKGSCSNHFQTLLNEGTLSVPDKESLKDIPAVPGLLSYRQDNNQLYVNNGTQWDALSSETEVEKLTRQMKILEDKTNALLLFRTCSAMKTKYPNLPSGLYDLYPDGIQRSSFKVYCDMTSKNGAGVMVIGHDSEQRTRASKSDRKIVYQGINMTRIAALISISKHCEQFIKYECISSTMYLVLARTWWVSRQGTKMRYWGGAAVNSYKCACGMTNSCVGSRSCNCDAFTFFGKPQLKEDSGYLTDKKTLPVTGLHFWSVRYSFAKGYHTLGKLKCWG